MERYYVRFMVLDIGKSVDEASSPIINWDIVTL